MKNGKIFWGVILISIGILFFLSNVFDLYLDLGDIFRFWPVVLILFGISVFVNNQLSKTIITVLSALLIGIFFFSLAVKPYSCMKDHTHWEEIETSDLDTLAFPLTKEIANVNLNLEGGAASFYVKSQSDSSKLYTLIGYQLTDFLDISNDEDGKDFTLSVKNVEDNIHIGSKVSVNKIQLGLNKQLLYNIDFNTGVSKGDLDLSDIRVNDLEINSGASSIKVKLGEPAGDTMTVRIETGASKIRIAIPESVGSEIKSDLSVSKKRYQGFSKMKDRIYRTPDFESMKKKILFMIDGGVASVHIDRY